MDLIQRAAGAFLSIKIRWNLLGQCDTIMASSTYSGHSWSPHCTASIAGSSKGCRIGFLSNFTYHPLFFMIASGGFLHLLVRSIVNEQRWIKSIEKNLKDWQVLEFRCRSTHAHFYFLLDYFCFLSSLWCPCYGLSSKVNLKVSAIRWTSIKGEILFSGRICGADTIWPLIRHAWKKLLSKLFSIVKWSNLDELLFSVPAIPVLVRKPCLGDQMLCGLVGRQLLLFDVSGIFDRKIWKTQ